MSRDEAFLRDIIEHPDDDAPRLIYADWLDDHGQPERAEFIRVQCELARLPEDDGCHEELWEREHELLTTHGEEWRGVLPEWVGWSAFERGFVASVSVAAEDFLHDPPLLWRIAPITALNVREAAVHVAGLVACPYLARLRSLELNDGGNLPLPVWFDIDGFDGGGAVALAASPYLGGLTRLVVGPPHRIGAEGVMALVNCPRLAQLTELELIGQGVGDAEVQALAESRYLRRLEVLNLASNEIGAAGARSLAGCSHFAGLRALNLNANSLGGQGTQALASSPHLNRLTLLRLQDNAIGPQGARALAATRQLKALATLNLADNELGAEGLAALVTGRRLARLRSLSLGNTEAGDPGVRILAGSPVLSGLRELELDGNSITDAGARALAASPFFGNLRVLDLYGNEIRALGARALAGSAALAHLDYLNLGSNCLRLSTKAFLSDHFGLVVSL